MDSGRGTTGGGSGRLPFWSTLEEFCKGLGHPACVECLF